MKQILLVGIVVLFLSSVNLFAQVQTEKEMNMEEVQLEIDSAMKEVEEAMNEININILVGKTSEDAPRMGIFLSDMDFEDAYKMHYPYCYGVYVTGVTQDGPAQKAGIVKGDVIMEFDGKKAKFESNLVKLIRSKNIGDEVKVKIYRDEEIFIADLTLATLKPKEITITKDGMKIKKKKKLSVGFGGGGWIPVWFVDDNKFDDINYILDAYGFNGLDEKGILMHGGGGNGNMGKGWFLGGMGAGYSIDKKKGHTTDDGTSVTRRMLYSNAYGGVTLDKRFAITKSTAASLGFMLGWGGHNLQISQTDGDYNWLELDDDMDSSANNAIELEKNYIMFQPKATVMYRIIDWLSIRAEGGYMLSHSYTSGWDAVSCEDNFEINNSPETPYQGYTISIGPWFGF
ncbi:MAG: PDZ domain-containing protein [Candidatus Tenebribacter burtonii]|nr:PDZ domain-containing protein [Candidatus Tenebribacter burtonii]